MLVRQENSIGQNKCRIHDLGLGVSVEKENAIHLSIVPIAFSEKEELSYTKIATISTRYKNRPTIVKHLVHSVSIGNIISLRCST
jgi:hypothetical protein